MRTASSAARPLASSRFGASGSISRTRPSDCILFPVRNACISWYFVNFQYPVAASGTGGGGAVS